MAPGKVATEFDAIIAAGRRQQNQALAQELLGTSRRSSAPGAGIGPRKTVAGGGGSLASRVGIVKRSSSINARPDGRSSSSFARAPKGDVDAEWTHDLHALNNPDGSTSAAGARASHQPAKKTYQTRTERLYAAFSNQKSARALNQQVNIVKPAPAPAKGFSIKGLAGPYTVVAKNFAPGTTAADIESAMVNVGGTCLESYLVQTRPVIIAELVFETKEGADAVVSTFDRQEADGNILHVYHKSDPANKPTAPARAPTSSVKPISSTANNTSTRSHPGAARSRDDGREDVMDGNYGFDDRMDTDDDRGRERDQRLYSDDMVRNNRYDHDRNADRGRDRRRDDGRGRSYYRGGGRY